MSDAKIKVNLKEGTVELEGSEEFVKSYWEKISTSLRNIPVVFQKESLPQMNSSQPNEQKKLKKSKKKGQNKQKKADLTLIPLDLKKNDKKPSLLEFFNEKKTKIQPRNYYGLFILSQTLS
jgi:hypothetical protein